MGIVLNTTGLIGHSDLLQRLGTALAQDTLHHGLLFEGPSGTGKATIAGHLAKAANCLDEDLAARPCHRCRACTTIAARNHPDVVWVEPDPSRASRTIAVAKIREVVRQSGYHRFSARKRFVIIDPAEAMLDPAANALLKTLEEPPDGTHFILIATAAKALLPTIVSRCQRNRFGAVDTATVAAFIAKRFDGVESDAIAAASLGCPGRAVVLAKDGLEKKRAVREHVLKVLEGPLPALFSATQKLCTGGRADWGPKADRWIETIEELLRDASLEATGARAPRIHADRPELIARWARALWPDGITRCADAIAACRADLERMVSGRTALDALMTAIREEVGAAS